MRHIIPISGKDSLCTALLQTAFQSDLEYEFVFNDTGCELPEVYEWLDAVERKTGWSIERVGESLEAIIDRYNGFLPGQGSRYCTREAKIQPMERWLGDCDAIVYYGLRADEPQRTGYVPIGSSRITPKYPLRPAPEGITPRGVDIEGVYTILEVQGLTPPSFFWQPVYDAVCDRLSGIEWESFLKPWQKRHLFAGRSRGNCYFCFYEQQAEYLWLLQTHPDLFWKAAGMEKTVETQKERKRSPKQSKYEQISLLEVESQPKPKAYTWREGYSLQELAESSAMQKRIFDRHVKGVVDQILRIVNQQSFGVVADSEIALTSCGLLCGK